MKRIPFLYLFVLFLLSSCVHHTPFVEEYYFQALGEESEIVITCDAERIKEGEIDEIIPDGVKSSSLMAKAERLTLSLLPDVEDFTLSGALEGDISSFGINSGLFFSSSYSREKDGGTVWYSGNGRSIYSPENGIVLFTEGSYTDFYTRSYSERVKKIDDSTAALMAGGVFSLYVFEPERLFDIGFELPQTVLDGIVSTCLVFNSSDGELRMSGFFTMEGESEARALNTLFRNQVIQKKRREGGKIDYTSLSGLFTVDGSTVRIAGLELTGEMKSRTVEMINERIGGLV